MKLIEQIREAWGHSRSARMVYIQTDPNPTYSRLDNLDGLRNTP